MKKYKEKYKNTVCYHPDKKNCKGKLKDCHTIQNNKILNKLAVNGKVFMFSSNVTLEAYKDFFECEEGDNIDKPCVVFDQMFQEIGRNYATTFKGFCDYHDTVVFQDIETRNFNRETIQFFEYAYRGLTHRLYERKKSLSLIRYQVTTMSGDELRNENKKTGYLGRLKLEELGISDLEKEKTIFDNAIMTQNYDIVVT